MTQPLMHAAETEDNTTSKAEQPNQLRITGMTLSYKCMQQIFKQLGLIAYSIDPAYLYFFRKYISESLQ